MELLLNDYLKNNSNYIYPKAEVRSYKVNGHICKIVFDCTYENSEEEWLVEGKEEEIEVWDIVNFLYEKQLKQI